MRELAFMNKKNQHSKNPNKNYGIKSWKSGRQLLSRSIALDLDLESRELIINNDDLSAHPVKIDSTNLDTCIRLYVDPEQSESVLNSLNEAGKGIERPICFNFTHPELDRKFALEYHYQIVYVSYSKTRLKGKLIKRRPSSA